VTKDGADLVACILSMGKLHHAMTGTGAVAAVIPGTVVHHVVAQRGIKSEMRIGHPSGMLTVGATGRRVGRDHKPC
jgi:2-methylaconitate cis-trans-isomerase PrpF